MMKNLSVTVCVALGMWMGVVHAQTAVLTPEQMIEQLRSDPPIPRTRSLRNLAVKPVAPSLSLQIQFDFNSTKVKPESQQALRNLAQALVSPDLLASRFAVEGHTDATGRADYNLRLSQQRADAVRDFMGQHGVDVTRLLASGKGSSEPVNLADPLAAENRRVRIVNLD